MAASIRVLAFTGAALVLAAGAKAETINSVEWGFSAAFPCQTQLASQPVPTKVGNVTMISYTCGTDVAAYFVAIADFPKGAITQQPSGAPYDGTISGMATNANGTIRSVTPFLLGSVTGRDAFIDIPSDHRTSHVRVFFVDDRQYQVMFLGPAGDENSKAALDFLNGFTLQNTRK